MKHKRIASLLCQARGGPHQANALKTGGGGVVRGFKVKGVGLLIRSRVRAGPAFLQSRDHLAQVMMGEL